eukprot:COSAG01_NODE_829_length_13273_cov_7.729695_11_plen_100_part_00
MLRRRLVGSLTGHKLIAAITSSLDPLLCLPMMTTQGQHTVTVAIKVGSAMQISIGPNTKRRAMRYLNMDTARARRSKDVGRDGGVLGGLKRGCTDHTHV